MVEYNGKKIILMACSDCNMNCEHCYISYTGNRNPSDLLELIKKLKNKYEIVINGAEVLTNYGYLESYKEIGQPFIMTNGLEIYNNPSVLDKIKNNNINTVSLSYHFGIHNDISGINTSQVEEVINKIQESGLYARLLTTITKKNYQNLDEMCEKAYQLGVRGIKFTNFLNQGNALSMDNDLKLTEKEKYEFFKLLLKNRKKYDINKLIIERCGSFGKDTYSEHSNFKCECTKNLVVITPDNYVYPCVFLAKPGYEIGKLEDGRIILDDVEENAGDFCYANEICNKNNKVKILKK